MTVRELREALAKFPDHAIVDCEVNGYSAVVVSLDPSGDYAVTLVGAEIAPDPDWEQ